MRVGNVNHFITNVNISKKLIFLRISPKQIIHFIKKRIKMSSTYDSYSIKQLNEAEANLLQQIERIRRERKERIKSVASDKEATVQSLWATTSPEKKEKPAKESPKEKAPKEKKAPKKEASKKEDGEERAIKATIASIKEVLNYHHIDFPSSAKKDELAAIVRKHNLVRECEKKDANKKMEKSAEK